MTEIKWNKSAVKQLVDVVQYLEDNEEFAYAEKIENQILNRIKQLSDIPAIHQVDRLKENNDGSFYAFEVDRYRISCRSLNNEIRILRIRHSSRRPFTR